jgi:hypothetical protein
VNPSFEHALKKHYGRRNKPPGALKPIRTVYRKYFPKLDRVTWYVSSKDESPYGPARLFGYFRRDRMWVLLETTPASLLDKINSRSHDRSGLDIVWRLSPDMRQLLSMMAAATKNETTLVFIEHAFSTMDRINRVKHPRQKHLTGESL